MTDTIRTCSRRAACVENIDGKHVGRDPRGMTSAELAAAGHASKSPLAAIRERCLDCCGGSPHEVRLCTAVGCALWPFRMGTNPHRKSKALSAEERAAVAERLARGRRAAALQNEGMGAATAMFA